MQSDITFCATGRTGLGHLRRITNVARAIAALRPDIDLSLITNGSEAGLGSDEISLYREIRTVERPDMSAALAGSRTGAVVVDTAVLPGLHAVQAPLCLLLRETVTNRLGRFRLENNRPWDLVLLANPAGEWTPDANLIPALRMEAVGWIYRSAESPGASPTAPLPLRAAPDNRCVLVATGGGGSGDTWSRFRSDVGALIHQLKAIADFPLDVVQVLGPRAGDDARIEGIDRVLRVGAALHWAFPQADLVISTVGYNSTLELACTDVPTLLVPIPATYDDQPARANRWGGRLGRALTDSDPTLAVEWMLDTLRKRARRAPVPLDKSGAHICAERLLEILR